VLVCLLLALGTAQSAAADSVSGGTVRLPLGPDLAATLHRAGVKLNPLGPAQLHGRNLALPVSGGELDVGVGRLSLRGGLKLTAGARSTSIGQITLDTGSGAMTAELGGRSVRLALARRPRVDRDGFGYEATLGKLVLTGSGARRLDDSLALPGLLGVDDVLGTAIAGIRFEQLAVAYGTAYLTLEESFLVKLRSLAVAVEPSAAGWYFSRSPLTLAFTGMQGSAALDLSAGSLVSTDGLRLLQAGSEGPRELALSEVSLDFAAKTLAAATSATSVAAAPSGPVASLQIPVFHKNAFTGVLSAPNSPAAVSPGLASLLNATFAAAVQPPPFAAGEALGQVAFAVGTHGKPH
jgi:hypothetical protein